MPRARNDPYKRKSAQALNHLAAAILDINDIYVPFEQQFQMLHGQMEAMGEQLGNVDETELLNPPRDQLQQELLQLQANTERYAGYVHDLETVMMGIAAVREHIILFIGEVWNLDEESVKVYFG